MESERWVVRKQDGARVVYANYPANGRYAHARDRTDMFYWFDKRARKEFKVRRQADRVAKRLGGQVVRLLTHDEACRKRAAIQLRFHAQNCLEQASRSKNAEYSIGLKVAADFANARADRLWPAKGKR